jgi:hypothetical protein
MVVGNREKAVQGTVHKKLVSQAQPPYPVFEKT